jgi:hypothetical protein
MQIGENEKKASGGIKTDKWSESKADSTRRVHLVAARKKKRRLVEAQQELDLGKYAEGVAAAAASKTSTNNPPIWQHLIMQIGSCE